MAPSILWYDLETFGLDSRHDRIAQFACLRTDENLEPVEEPASFLCKPPPDYLPSPYSCLVHGISPRTALDQGLPEYEFAAAIHARMRVPSTTVAGYNSVRFDDEFTRNLFYRNLIDPYEREWADGNSRWDVMDLFRAARDLRPDGMRWPDGPDGKPDFRLVALAEANGVPLENAHDAAFDIRATVRLAAMVRERQGRLYDWYWKHRTRDSLKPLIDLAERTPLVHSSAVWTSARGCTTIVAPVGMIPGRRDGLVAVDLRADPSPLVDLPVDELRRRAFSRAGDLAEGERLPLVNLKLGRCPFLAPLSILDAGAAARLGLDPAEAAARAKALSREPELIQKLSAVFGGRAPDPAETDPDYRIYSGGFFKDDDRDAMASVHEAIAALGPAVARPQAYALPFLDERLPQMVRRLFARNWPETLSAAEAARWRSFCAGRLLCPRIEGATDLAGFGKTVESLLASMETPAEDKRILAELLEYRSMLESSVLSWREGGTGLARPSPPG